ncbi:YjzD family protein [Sediminibacillus massiliensis]|uniref:YjzD family protein n=1 Tax=Sediminibacillus massiliensis TaxID=1926277 RepID=UPI00098851C6|nr:YjzD family protein [Sediminibacillus massiliensis]
MRYLWTIVWSFLLSFLISYVLSSMAGETLPINQVLVLTVIFAVAVIILGDGVLKEEKDY